MLRELQNTSHRFRQNLSRMHKKTIRFCITNIVLLACGIATLVTGIWLYTAKNDFIELTPASYSALSAAGLCVFTGITTVIISMVGFCGVYWKKVHLIYAYTGFVVVLLFAHGVTRLTGFFIREEAHENLRMNLLKNINVSYMVTKLGRRLPLKLTWDQLQIKMECCGVDSYQDWFHSVQWPENEFVPDSCCDPQHFSKEFDAKNCGKVFTGPEMLYEDGCYDKFSEWLSHHVTTVSWISSLLIIVEVLAIIFSISIARHIKNPPLRRSNQPRRNDELIRMNDMDRIGDANYFPMPIDAISIDSR